jgi:hypothetical protein
VLWLFKAKTCKLAAALAVLVHKHQIHTHACDSHQPPLHRNCLIWLDSLIFGESS